ncbi:MAG: hypothetical protein HRU18_11075 [Pseudoalteromonas sp.]|uniref:hypothetical protein n=1 Tax=Pseudoalteromonas sp. TaxID=53249 RepID=UPI001D26A854|nr:hypothetical protein [Pseudoalteromonas sp.]NRA78741.1 hypothetical protein [Pseudoalteromonas sp.]
MANEIYEKTWWGKSYIDGFGAIYYDYALSPEVIDFENRVLDDGGIVESLECISI